MAIHSLSETTTPRVLTGVNLDAICKAMSVKLNKATSNCIYGY